MDIESFREYCLSLGEVTEKTPFAKFSKRFENILVFYVSNHMFCLTDIDNFTAVEVVSTSDEIKRLTSEFTSVGKPGNPTLKNWIKIALNGDISQNEILALIKKGYELIMQRYKK